MEAQFLPYLPGIMKQLFAAMSTNIVVSPDQYDLDRLEEQSDIEMIETDDGNLVAIRHTAVEELVTACQLLILLSEKLQEHFYPYVQQSLQLVAQLFASPHEDIRSFAMVSLPELVRSVGRFSALNSLSHTDPSILELALRSTAQGSTEAAAGLVATDTVHTILDTQFAMMQYSVKSAVETVAAFCVGLLLPRIQKESSLALIITGIQSLKQVVLFGSSNWIGNVCNNRISTMDGLATSSYFAMMNTEQLGSIASVAKVRRDIYRSLWVSIYSWFGNLDIFFWA